MIYRISVFILQCLPPNYYVFFVFFIFKQFSRNCSMYRNCCVSSFQIPSISGQTFSAKNCAVKNFRKYHRSQQELPTTEFFVYLNQFRFIFIFIIFGRYIILGAFTTLNLCSSTSNNLRSNISANMVGSRVNERKCQLFAATIQKSPFNNFL